MVTSTKPMSRLMSTTARLSLTGGGGAEDLSLPLLKGVSLSDEVRGVLEWGLVRVVLE
jgi:hypothetical protein